MICKASKIYDYMHTMVVAFTSQRIYEYVASYAGMGMTFMGIFARATKDACLAPFA